MEMKKKITAKNPIIDSDFPDPDIIRVGDTYYMASTTMHFMPGCVILRSYDLVRWEILSHAYQELDNTPRYYMEGKQNIYGEGMWAPTFRYHKGTYYIVFTANDTHKSHLLTASIQKDRGNIEQLRVGIMTVAYSLMTTIKFILCMDKKHFF